MSAILKLTVIFLGGLLATGLLFGLLVNPMLGRLGALNLEVSAAKTGTEEELDIEEEEVDVKPKDQKPPVVANKPGLDEIRYRLTLLNDFAGIVEFIKYMEHLPQFTEKIGRA